MTPTTIVLIAVVWAGVGLAVAVWRLRRAIRLLEHRALLDGPRVTQLWAEREYPRRSADDFSFVYDQLSALYRRVEALEEPRDTTGDLDVPICDGESVEKTGGDVLE